MKKCKKCGNDFTPSKGLISYCSLSCRNSKKHSKATRRKISKGVKKAHKEKEISTWNYEKGIIAMTLARKKCAEEKKQNLLSENFNNLSPERKRKRVIIEQEGRCSRCNLYEWVGYEIILELEHKNGNRLDNRRKNLCALCPNCHSLTKTWRGRNRVNNKYNKQGKISDKKLLKALVDNNFNMSQALIQVGLSPRGGNYNRCHKLKNIMKTTQAG